MKVECVLRPLTVGLLGMSFVLAPLACTDQDTGTKEEAAVTEGKKAKTEGKTKATMTEEEEKKK